MNELDNDNEVEFEKNNTWKDDIGLKNIELIQCL